MKGTVPEWLVPLKFNPLVNPSGKEEAQNYLTVNLQEQPAKIDDDFQFRKRYSFCQLHRQKTPASKNVRQTEISSIIYPEKIGDFENWDESEEFKDGMQVCAATFSFLEEEEDIQKMLIYQKATESAIVNGEKDEIATIFEEEGSESEDGDNYVNFFAFIVKKTTKDDSASDFGVLSNIEFDDDIFLKNITEEYFGDSLEFLGSNDISENGEYENAKNPENNEENLTNLQKSADDFQNIEAGCKLQFIPIDEDHCGHVLPSDTFENIQNTCSSIYNSTLPIPTSFEENYLFSTFMPKNNLTGYNEFFWLGIKRNVTNSQNSWRTIDDDNVQLTLWANEGNENCAIVVRFNPWGKSNQ